MTAEEIIEGNKLIAEFMELRKENSLYGISTDSPLMQMQCIGEFSTKSMTDDDSLETYFAFEAKELRYHDSWDWLMPVVEKIEAMVLKFNDFNSVQIGMMNAKKGTLCTINTTLKVIQVNSKSKINSVWLAIVKFIQHYNEFPNKFKPITT